MARFFRGLIRWSRWVVTLILLVLFTESCGPSEDVPPEGSAIRILTGMMEVPGGQLYYEEAGSGEAVLLVHGNTGDRRHWDLQFEGLARTHRVIRYDLRGFGASTVPAEGVRFTNHGDAATLLDGLGIRRAHVAGWSLGSAIAIDFAMAFPERTLSLMVVGPWIMGYDSPGAQEMFQGMGQVAMAMAEEGSKAAVEALMNSAFMTRTIQKPAAGDRFRAIAEDYSFWGFVNPSSQMVLDPPALGRTHEIRAPTLIVAGEFDVPACMEIGEFMDETIPDSRMVVMPGTGHLMLMEQPEVFSEILIGFLDQHSGREASFSPTLVGESLYFDQPEPGRILCHHRSQPWPETKDRKKRGSDLDI